MRHTISVLVKNRPGVLAALSTIFQQHKLNILSISAGETEREDVSRIILCVGAEATEAQSVAREIEAREDVLRIEDLSGQELIDRELVLIKVSITKDTVSQILQIFEVFRANVVDMGNETIAAELSATQGKVAGLIRALEPHGIRSLSRTGLIAIKRGDD